MRTFRTITLANLRDIVAAAIETHGEDMRAAFTSEFGYYHHTPQAFGFTFDFARVRLTRSAYSHSGYAIAPMVPICPECDGQNVVPIVAEAGVVKMQCCDCNAKYDINKSEVQDVIVFGDVPDRCIA